MKTERAIELLNRISDEQFDGIHGDERREALEMAVMALEQNLVKESDSLVKDLVKDCISRQAAIDAVYSETVSTNPEHFKSSEKFIKFMDDDDIASFGKWQWANGFNTAVVAAKIQLEKLPSAQPETHDKRTETHACDCISRAEAIELKPEFLNPNVNRETKEQTAIDRAYARGWNSCNTHWIKEIIENLPSAQPERTCVNCGRTANNGGWYADGRTRCPIEEHYALPKDGYCHLWEKRNVTDDDYPERREDERPES